ncbi:hypothetical protein A6B43_08445 [Vespertiliibacter pulmonis]|nr:hypothetical protein A6B43_08445 [Vespertiliibacter pulmonis]
MKKSILSVLFYLTTLTYSANSMALSPPLEEIKQAAEQGDAKAQYNLGVAYDNGQGVPQSYIEAKALYKQACENGNQKGCDQYKRLNLSGY